MIPQKSCQDAQPLNLQELGPPPKLLTMNHHNFLEKIAKYHPLIQGV